MMKIMNFNKKILVSALLPLFLLSACGESSNQQAQRPPMNVSTITLESQPVTIFTTLPGRINAIKDAVVIARVTGNIQSIQFEQGSRVKAGQALFKIDPAVYQANVNAAQASLSQATANASSAAALANRYRTLIKENAVSRQEYDQAIASAKQTAAAVEAAKAALDAAQIDLSYTDVISPIDGIVGAALVTEGALVSATSGTQLAKVQQINEVYVDFTQSTTEMMQLRKAFLNGELERVDNNTAAVRLILEDGSTYNETGKLLFSGVSVDETTGKVNLRATFPNSDELLLPGMFVRVRLERGINNNAVLVPNQALQRKADGSSFVYTVEEGKVALRPVTVGEVVDNKTIVTSGLKSGDQLIVEGFTKIGPGAPINALPWAKDPNVAAQSAAGQQKENASDQQEPANPSAE
ncbi:efflux RND transporter periplasmic adaptor subunit [Pelistega sp. NLN82]|uniref:Efflux RND transporter periplasmic adaptor subunit n=2 Tax=Pelistega ratti TaxID=2652177 RepID=A0A6L9Y566_9BURK|nr:efflux RND transporter periplasmic adaptor subunit [Pelistega ratti]NEN75107.1 efflux RND transporter periplasmic adaptor subunit [Pelistega ratti]